MKPFLLFGVVAAVVAARAARAQGESVHLGISVGAGFAYDGVGGRLELHGDSFGIYAGTGLFAFTAEDVGPGSSSGGCAGLYVFPRGEGRGLFISLNGTMAEYTRNYDPGVSLSQKVSGSLFTLTATVGNRWRWGHLFLDAAIGAGAAWNSYPPAGYSGSPPPGAQNHDTISPIPDVELGFGVEL